jgi:hypothetical protein
VNVTTTTGDTMGGSATGGSLAKLGEASSGNATAASKITGRAYEYIATGTGTAEFHGTLGTARAYGAVVATFMAGSNTNQSVNVGETSVIVATRNVGKKVKVTETSAVVAGPQVSSTITRVQTSTAAAVNTASGSVTPTLPNPVTVGNLVVIFGAMKTATGGATINTPAGWTQIDQPPSQVSSVTAAAFYRANAPAGLTLPAITSTSGSQDMWAYAAEYSGVGSTLDTHTQAANTASTSPITTGTAGPTNKPSELFVGVIANPNVTTTTADAMGGSAGGGTVTKLGEATSTNAATTSRVTARAYDYVSNSLGTPEFHGSVSPTRGYAGVVGAFMAGSNTDQSVAVSETSTVSLAKNVRKKIAFAMSSAVSLLRTLGGVAISRTEIKTPNGAHMTNPSAIACAPNGLVGVIDMSVASVPDAYFSGNAATTFTDVQDTFFLRSAREVTHAALSSAGRWFVTMGGPGMIVYDAGIVVSPTQTAQTTFDYIIGTAGTSETSANFDEVSTTVALSELLQGAQSANGTGYVTATLTPTSGRIVYALIESATSNGATPNQPTASGAGLTWTAVKTVVWDAGNTSERRRMTVFAGIGTPTPGAVTFSFAGQTQSHGIWRFIESEGQVVQSLSASAPNVNSITINPTPIRTPTTFLSFAAHKSGNPVSPGLGSQNFTQQATAVSPSALMPMLTSTNAPIAITASASDVKDFGMIVLELGTKATPTALATFDYIISGTAVSIPGKARATRDFLSKVYATIGGNEIPLQSDWEFTETSYGGYDHAQFSVPEEFARRRPNLVDPDSHVTFWNASGDELWTGQITKPPQYKDGYAYIEAQGEQYKARGTTDRLMYQVAGTDGWASADADPYNYISDHLFDVAVDPGRLLVKISKVDNGETQLKQMFQNGDQAGWVLWVQDADVARVAFTIRKSDNIPNFNLIGWLVDGPSENLSDPSRVFNLDLNDAANPDGTHKDIGGLRGHHDLVVIMVSSVANNLKPDKKATMWLQDVRVNGLADGDDMTTSQVARDIAYRLGWTEFEIEGNDYNALPFDVNDMDWGAALDYLSDLDNLPWQVYDGVFRRAGWDTAEYETSRESGALIDLAPEQIYDTVSVAWTGTSGKKHVETVTQGNGAIYPAVDMQDDQRNGNNANDYAKRLLAEYGSERYSGTVTIYNGSRLMHAGRNLVITDWDQGASLHHKITTVTQREDSIQLTIGWPEIVSHFLARLQQKQKRSGR